MKLARSAHVSRSEKGDYHLRWTPDFTEGAVSIYAGQTPESISVDKPVVVAAFSQAQVSALDNNKRYYFLLQPETGENLIVSERVLPLSNGVNFRDFGGYPAADGRRIRWGKFYRSGHMARLAENDVSYLAALDIKVCCDFRSEIERQKEPSLLPSSTEVVALMIAPGSMQEYFELLADGKKTAEQMPEMMQQLNIELAENHTDQYGEMLERLCDLETGAFLVNCSAGKDRTGFGVALIMMALGVPREAIIHDYLLSQKYFARSKEMVRLIAKYSAQSSVDAAILEPMLEAREEYLSSALDHIEAEYGMYEDYLMQKFALNQHRLQALRARFTV